MSKDDVCPNCLTNDFYKELLTPNTIHYSKTICTKCSRWIRWNHNPQKVKYRSSTTKHKMNLDFCKICGRKEQELGWNETLEIHHLIPLDEGGEDTPENILVTCTACHKLIHWIRLYFNKHMRKFYEKNG